MWGARRVSFLFVIVIAIVAALPVRVEAGDESGPVIRLEHLVIRPERGGPDDGYAVLDVARFGSARPGDTVTLPLPAGYRELRVLGGLVEGTIRAGASAVSGSLAAPAAQGELSGADAAVALSYFLPNGSIPHPWSLKRPYPVSSLLVMLHPDARFAVAGAEAAGTVELEGVTYQGYVRQDLAAGDSVLLARAGGTPSTSRSAGGLASGRAWWAVAAGVLLVAAAGVPVAWILTRRRRATAVAGGARTIDHRSRRRWRGLAEAIASLDAEYRAGYLEEDAYAAHRARLLAELAAARPGEPPTPDHGPGGLMR